jgi:hypothetical protein
VLIVGRYQVLTCSAEEIQSGPKKMYTLFTLYFTVKSVYIFLGHCVFLVEILSGSCQCPK